MEIIISGKIAAYGMLVRNIFDKKKVVNIKNFRVNKFKKIKSTALPIFFITDIKQITFLKGAMENHFEKAIICTDITSVSYLSISKPHVFVSLNQLKTDWMNDVIEAAFKLIGEETNLFLNKNNNVVQKYLDTLKTQQQNAW